MKYTALRLLLVGELLTMVCGIVNAQAPANDECSVATVISTLPFSTTQNTRLATVNATDPVLTCADGGGGKSVWFVYTPAATQWVKFSTIGSTPTDYDVALALFTGSCGTLTEVRCNDDAEGTRQSVVFFEVQMGTTYYLHVAEWMGGGPSGGTPTGGDLVLNVLQEDPPPPVKGSKTGTVASGVSVNTASFPTILPKQEPEPPRFVPNKIENFPIVTKKTLVPPKGPEGSNYIEDRGELPLAPTVSRPIVSTNFDGIQTGAFPPDPIVAVGPSHVMACVNSTFRIWDKSGTILKTITASAWHNTIAPGSGPNDPQIIYDHHSNRWVMQWMTSPTATEHYHMFSVSDDSDPLGTWYIYKTSATLLGDSSTQYWGDYPQMGYDDQAIYLTSRQFHLTLGSFGYIKLRIIPKSQLYANTGGSITYKDFWDFRDPSDLGVSPDGIFTTITFGSPSVSFLVNDSPFRPGTYFTVRKISDPTTTPTITAFNVPVVSYSSAPNAGQPNASLTPFEGGGSRIRSRVIYQDSSLYVVHSVASGPSNLYSAVHYVRINPFTQTNLEDVAMGLTGYWHFYPTIMLDKEKNIIIGYSRSGTTEYAGAFATGRRYTDPVGLSPSIPIKRGEAGYEVLQVSGTSVRNRWGDYNGIALDPSDSLSIWTFTEYADSPGNRWGTWVAKLKMGPLAGAFVYYEPIALNFGTYEVGSSGDTMKIDITNNGLDTLVISSITYPDSHFVVLNPPTLPWKIPTYQAESLMVKFSPQSHGSFTKTITLTSNDGTNPTISITLTGNGFSITPAQAGILYATSGQTDGGRLHSVTLPSVSSTPIGPSGYSQIVSARVHPTTNEILGLAPSGANHFLVRINSLYGDAHPTVTIPVVTLKGMAFRGDTLYVGRINGALYRVDMNTGSATQVATTGLNIAGLAFHPVTGQLWACVRSSINPDNIYKIQLPSGAVTLVGNTGLGVVTQDIVFDASGNMFGLTGTGSTINSVILIDTATGTGTVIGSLGIPSGQALAIRSGTSFNANTYRLASQWNMISVPLLVSSYLRSSIFPTSASSGFIYQGRYVMRDTLENGPGYWMRFDQQTVRNIIGSLNTLDTVDVSLRWNMIGSLSTAIPLSGVTSIPSGIIISDFLTYTDTGYSTASMIEPGKAYWVKVSSDGKLVLSSTYNSTKDISTVQGDYGMGQYHSILVRNSNGCSQTLYFGALSEQSINLDKYELPPPPPSGVFDVRFGSGRMLEVHSPNQSAVIEYPIVISSPTERMNVEWKVNAERLHQYSLLVLVDKPSSGVTQVLRGEGKLTLNNANKSILRLRVEQNAIPAQYALMQNYPNPFNPITDIRFALSEVGFTSLKIYNVLGEQVATLINEVKQPGEYRVEWDAHDRPSGVYFYQLVSGKFYDVKKMILIR